MSILNNKLVGINQILPHKNKWAWDLFMKGCSNHWMPTEISMKKDIEQWMDKDGFSEDERLVIKRCLGFFAGAESLVSNNLLLTIFRYINDGECYSSDTQILTSDGWKYFYNLTDDDKVAEFDINTNEVEFIKPLNIIKKEYEGDMIQINNKLKHIDLLVTPNHELLLQNHKKEYIKINSDKKIPRNYKFIHGGKKNSGKNVLSFEERFMIALQADGSLKDERLKSKYKYITCEFSFTKDRKKRRFEYILSNTSFKYKKRSLKNNVVKYYVRCPKEFAKKYFNWVNIELVSSSWASEFLEELGEWDADKNDKNTRLKYCNYYSKISENVDIIQALCSISGSYRSKRRLRVDNRKETFSDIHGIGFLKYDKYTCCQNLTQEKVAYNGMVYCVTVPKGNIIVRRNNSVVVCGNCRQYLGRQNFEENLHNLTVVYCCDSLRLDIKEVYEAYQNIPAIKRKDDFLTELTKDSNKDDIDVNTIEGKKKVLKNIITYYILCEGLLFYSGFALLLNFKRYDKLHGLAQQIAYTMRDECVSKDTELLTPFGWKNVTEISKNDKIAQYDDNGNISFVNPIKLSKTFCSEIYNFNNFQKHIDLSVSENHRMVILNKLTNKKQIITAKDCKFHPYNAHIMAGNKIDGDIKDLTAEEKFLIAFQADGSMPTLVNGKNYRNGKQCGYIQVRFSFRKERKKERLREILKDCNFEYNEKPSKKEGFTTFSIKVNPNFPKKQLSEWINLENKNIEWCKKFIEEISLWDGHKVSNSNRVTYGSIIKSNSDIIQAIASLCNYRTHLKIIEDNRKDTFSDYNRLQICKNKNYFSGGTIKKEKIDYNDYVYGVEVPSGMIVVRRNNCVAITGNCIHVEFGTNLIKLILEEIEQEINDEDELKEWKQEFKKSVTEWVKEVVDIEKEFINEIIPNGILGLNKNLMYKYIEFLANIRLTDLGLKAIFKGVNEHPLLWITEVVEMQKQVNFFEDRPTEYKNAGAYIDDL